MITLQRKISELNKVGKSVASRLKNLGIETVFDLIFYYPFRYDDFSEVLDIGKLEAGTMVTVRGRVEIIGNKRSSYRKKNITEAIVSDLTGSVRVVWFNQPWISKNLKPGDEIFLSGKVSGDLFDLFFNSPGYEKTDKKNINTARLVPIYSTTQGITQKQIRFLVENVIELSKKIEDFLPSEIIKEKKLFNLNRAIQEIHFPSDQESLGMAKKRLAFDEVFLVQLWSLLSRQRLNQSKALRVNFFETETKNLIKSFGFELTADQKKSAWEIIKDLEKDKPMNRLLEGDVGSGKTAVASLAIFNVSLNGYQSALMAPTEILAGQHFKTLTNLFKNNLRIGLLTRTQKVINDLTLSKNDFLEKCVNGEIDLVVGTHALVQREIEFKNLALTVIDEQHRFGVGQRQTLRNKGESPHLLSLTATPIPRSLALTIYGDLSISVIKQKPKNRKKIITRLVSPGQRRLAYDFITKEVEAGRQVFVVCPLIDVSDKLGVKSVTQEFEKLSQEVFPKFKIGLLHGKMKPLEKEESMSKMLSGETQILVATSVVEVGIDIPNASVMIIEGAERFGLAQLHQFRGRVGRSENQSYCFLFPTEGGNLTTQRLKALVECDDGFILAQKDLAIRGAGQLYGYSQSGFSTMKIADLNDLEFIQEVKLEVDKFSNHLVSLGENVVNDYPLITERLKGLNFSEHFE